MCTALTVAELTCILMHTGVSSCSGMTAMSMERYTRVLMDASPEFPIHFLNIYSVPPIRLHRRFHHTKAPIIRIRIGSSTSVTRKLYHFLSGLWRRARPLTQRLDQSVFLLQNRPTDILPEGLGLFLPL